MTPFCLTSGNLPGTLDSCSNVRFGTKWHITANQKERSSNKQAATEVQKRGFISAEAKKAKAEKAEKVIITGRSLTAIIEGFLRGA